MIEFALATEHFTNGATIFAYFTAPPILAKILLDAIIGDEGRDCCSRVYKVATHGISFPIKKKMKISDSIPLRHYGQYQAGSPTISQHAPRGR